LNYFLYLYIKQNPYGYSQLLPSPTKQKSNLLETQDCKTSWMKK